MADRPGRFTLKGFEPAYVATHARSQLAEKVKLALRELESCCACPRNCAVDRLADEKTGVCGVGRRALVTSAGPHLGEEDCLRGWRGSGTIFFGGCNLGCVFCQNWDISQRPSGQEVNAEQIAELMLGLQQVGCHNINFVTPEHVVPQVIEALAAAIPRGLRLPIVYNTSGYDSVDSLRLLEGLVDIYMPDFKFWQSTSARDLCLAKDYPQRAREAIAEMHRQVGVLRFDRRGIALRGVLIRHLVMPGLLDESKAIFEWLADELSPDTFVNVMGQYRPAHKVGRVAKKGKDAGQIQFQHINRPLAREELEKAHELAQQAGLRRLDNRWRVSGE